MSAKDAGRARLFGEVVYELIPMKNAIAEAGYLPRGATVSVTASPAKGMTATVDLCEQLVTMGFDVVPHLSARLTKSKEELAEVVRRLSELGLRRAFVVGGDADDPGEFPDALSLLRALDEMGRPFERIGIAAHPEGHPSIPDRDLSAALLDKQPYASYMATQMCFDVARIRSWILEQRALGITLPVVVGVPGVVETGRLMSIAARIGVGTSLRYLAKNRRAIWRLLRPGPYRPGRLIEQLVRAASDESLAIAGVHVFTFNQVEATARFYEGAAEAAAR